MSIHTITKINRQQKLTIEPRTPQLFNLPHPIIARLFAMIAVLGSAAIQAEYVHRLRVRAGDQVLSTSAERERDNRDTTFEAASQLEQAATILGAEHTNHSAALAGRRYLCARRTKSNGRQWGVMGGYHSLGVQVDGIEDLHLATCHAARVGQVAVLRRGGECTQAQLVAGRIAYGVHHLHILYVVDVERLLQADNQALPIQLHSQNCIRVRVITNFALLLEMANFQFAWRSLRHNGNQRALEESLNQE